MVVPAIRMGSATLANEISFGHWKWIELAIGETLPGRVTEVVGPDLFYAVPVERKDKEKLDQQLTDLEDYCKSQKNCSFKPKLGEACWAKFSGGGHWCRAVVLKVSQSVVGVLLADCGNTDTLPFSELLPITDSHLELPFQTIGCSLAGIEKVDCSLLSLDKLKEMLLNKYHGTPYSIYPSLCTPSIPPIPLPPAPSAPVNLHSPTAPLQKRRQCPPSYNSWPAQ